MRGRTHVGFGILAGMGVSALGDLSLSAITLGVAGLSALAPDLDEPQALLGQKIAVSPWRIRIGLGGIGILVSGYGYTQLTDWTKNVFLIMGLALVVLALLLRDRNVRRIAMLFSGGIVTASGFILHFPWMIALGIFVGVSPFFKHRTWCHTIWSLGIWTYIGWGAEQSLYIEGLMWCAFIGFLSHLITDGLTESGIKPFYPFSWTFRIPLMSVGSRRGNMVEYLMLTFFAVAVAALYGIHISIF